MKILNLNISTNYLYNNENNKTHKSSSLGDVKINTLSSDIVSFSAKPKKNGDKKNKNHSHQNTQQTKRETSTSKIGKQASKLKKQIKLSAQTSNPQEARARRLEKQTAKEQEQQLEVEAKIAYEHSKAETKKRYINPNLQTRIKEQIISDKELSFIIDKIKDYPELVGETFLEADNGELLFKVSDNITKKILESATDYNSLLNLITTEDENGKVFMEKIPTSKLVIFNNTLKQMPGILITAYLTPNQKKQLPAHYLPLEGLKIMNETLEDYPAILAQIYTHADNIGNTPMHNRFKKGQAIIKEALAYQPETLTKIRKIRNKYDEYPETILKKAENYSGPFEETWTLILNEF